MGKDIDLVAPIWAVTIEFVFNDGMLGVALSEAPLTVVLVTIVLIYI